MSKTPLQEKLGVPSNLIPSAVKLYDSILEYIENNVNKEDDEYEFTIKPRPPYLLGDVEIHTVKIKLIINHHSEAPSVDYLSMGVKARSKYLKPGLTKVLSKDGVADIDIEIITPIEYEVQDIINWFKKDKSELLSSLAHELKHVFDNEKKSIEKMSTRSGYSAAQNTRFGLPPLDKLAFNIYYTHLIENLVRPTEILAYLEADKIDKRNFLEYLKSNKTYQRLMDVKQWSLSDTINDIEKNYMGRVNDILEMVDEDMEGSSDREKVNFILDLWVRNYLRNNMESFQSQMSENFFEQMFGFPTNKEKALERHKKRLTKIDNYMEFIKYEDTLTKSIADKVSRKIHKLYDYLPSEEKQNINYKINKKINPS